MAIKPSPLLARLLTRASTLGLGGILVLGALFRVLGLRTLPPGLSGGEATLGLSALRLIHHGIIPGFTADTGYSPLWVALQSVMVAIFGHTVLALRWWPLLIGLASIAAVWLWARDWFEPRVAWTATILMAVTPWAVTLSRSASPAILVTLLVPLGLWLGGRAITRQGASRWWWLTSAVFVLLLISGSLGWLSALMMLVLGISLSWSAIRLRLGRRSLGGLILAALAGALVAVWLVLKWHRANLLAAANISWHPATLVGNLGKVAGMFNLHGDDSFLHNFNGEPMLNAFVGLMFIAGLLVAATRLPRRRYAAVLITFVIGLVPAVISSLGVPNSFHSAIALPAVTVLAGIGVGYMLELWYATFPINSAARSTGLAAIILLLTLTVFQGYVQVFRAWAGSVQTYQAYNEAAVSAAHFLAKPSPAPIRYVVAPGDEQTVITYLNYGHVPAAISPDDIATIPVGTGLEQFVITASVRDATAKQLASKFPGGKLQPHLSSFSGNELFYDYEITK